MTTSPFASLARQAPDTLLSLIALYRNDARAKKIDLGIGVYKNADGETPIFAAVKSAEAQLVRDQPTKAYIGPEGDPVFVEHVKGLVFGADASSFAGVQTPGGTGALRLGFDLLALAEPKPAVWLGEPTWANHAPVVAATGLPVERYIWVAQGKGEGDVAALMAAVERANSGDVFLLHGACHNPTGCDLTAADWRMLAEAMARRGLVPFIDLAYHGLGRGLDKDTEGLRIVARNCPSLIVAYSCDKNFGLYRERTGALFVRGTGPEVTDTVLSNVLTLARANWSMPPDHGGAVARIILESDGLRRSWHAELDAMRNRLVSVRTDLASRHPLFFPIAAQYGLFSMLPLLSDQVVRLRQEHGIYMTSNARINIAGLNEDNIGRFADAVASVAT